MVLATVGPAHASETTLPKGIPEVTRTKSDCYDRPLSVFKAKRAAIVNASRMSLPACEGLWQPPKPQVVIGGQRTYVNDGPGYEYSCRKVRENLFGEAVRAAFLNELPVQADFAHDSENKRRMACVSAAMYEWAKSDALTVLAGSLVSATGEPEGDLSGNQIGRAMALEALAGVYFKYPGLRATAMATKTPTGESQHDVIRAWLKKLAGFVLTDGPDRWTRRRASNVVYRQGNALMLVGQLVGNKQFILAGQKAFGLALSEITPEGFLPRELIRQSRALGYHSSALAPLVSTLTLSKSNGCEIRISAKDEERFLKLFARVLQGQKNPRVFSDLTGLDAQESTGDDAGALLALLHVHSPAMYKRLDKIAGTYGTFIKTYEAEGALTKGSNLELGGKLRPIAKEAQRRSLKNKVCAD